MFLKNKYLPFLFGFALTGFASGPADNNAAEKECSSSANHTSERRTASPAGEDGELSCLQQCGQEARGTVYAECLSQGGEKQTCGTTGRQWYRECLETRCDESAIQFDNCRTDCRINAKKEHHQCVEGGGEAQECRSKKDMEVRECISECE